MEKFAGRKVFGGLMGKEEFILIRSTTLDSGREGVIVFEAFNTNAKYPKPVVLISVMVTAFEDYEPAPVSELEE